MKYDIGDHVSVKARMVRIFDAETKQVSWKRKEYDSPRQGRIVGLARRYSGKRHSGYYFSDEESTSGYLEVSNSHTFWLVRFGMLNKEIHVDDADLYKVSEDCWKKTPKLKIKQYVWSESDRQSLRDCIASVPRDSKGRFAKESV